MSLARARVLRHGVHLEEVEETRVADERVYAGRRLHVEIDKKEDQRTGRAVSSLNPISCAGRRSLLLPTNLRKQRGNAAGKRERRSTSRRWATGSSPTIGRAQS